MGKRILPLGLVGHFENRDLGRWGKQNSTAICFSIDCVDFFFLFGWIFPSQYFLAEIPDWDFIRSFESQTSSRKFKEKKSFLFHFATMFCRAACWIVNQFITLLTDFQC